METAPRDRWVYLRRPLRDGFVAQRLQGLHGSVVSGCLAGASLSDELVTPHRQLHKEDLRNRIVVPAMRENKEHSVEETPDIWEERAKVGACG